MTQQQIDQLRLNSSRQCLTLFGAYAAGAMDASEWQRKHDIEEFLQWLKRSGDFIKDRDDEDYVRKELENLLQ